MDTAQEKTRLDRASPAYRAAIARERASRGEPGITGELPPRFQAYGAAIKAIKADQVVYRFSLDVGQAIEVALPVGVAQACCFPVPVRRAKGAQA